MSWEKEALGIFETRLDDLDFNSAKLINSMHIDLPTPLFLELDVSFSPMMMFRPSVNSTGSIRAGSV